MEKLLALLLSLILVLLCRGDDWVAPDFCNDRECPEFKVVESLRGDIELRKYSATNWIATKIKDLSFIGLQNAHNTLMAYWTEQEETGDGIDLDTWPVVVDVTADEGMWLSWFVSSESNMPEENRAEIKLIRRPTFRAYVITFGGYPSREKAEAKAKELSQFLFGECNRTHHYAMAVYDGLFAQEYHNEIWIDAEAACED